MTQFYIDSSTIIEAEDMEEAEQKLQDQRLDGGGSIAEDLLNNATISGYRKEVEEK